MEKVLTELKDGASYKPIQFKKMDECDGRYDISNKGHIRSNYGTMKIIKHLNHYGTMRVNLYDKNKKMNTYKVSDLMAKYWNAT